MRQFIDDRDEARHFLRREMFARPLRDLGSRYALPRPGYHSNQNFIFPEFGRHCDGRDFEYRRMLANYAIELRARNVFPAAPDDVFFSGHEKEIAVRVAPYEVAGQ